jgi:hypothetical protein
MLEILPYYTDGALAWIISIFLEIEPMPTFCRWLAQSSNGLQRTSVQLQFHVACRSNP